MFWVAEDKEPEFKAIFGTAGIWTEFLTRGSGYLGTELQCESVQERRYRVLDFWFSHLRLEEFREKFASVQKL
jgi:hypothetical protein